MPVSKLQNQVVSQLEGYLSKNFLIAVSGGIDSVVLLDLLVNLIPIDQLMVVHVNHQLRGVESDEDAQLVRELAAIYGCRYIEYSCDVQQVSEQKKLSIETAARQVRQQFFAQAQAEYKIDVVVLAHHADDQAETILFNLLRGSVGLKGMNLDQALSIRIEEDEFKLQLLRPLLKIRRFEIEAYQQCRGLSYREDSSNAELAYTRNRLRHEVFPLLEEVMQRDVKAKLLMSCELSASEELTKMNMKDYLDSQSRLVVPAVLELSQNQQQEMLKCYLQNRGVVQLTSRLILSAVELLTDLTKPSINLPKGGKLRRKEKRIWVQKKRLR